MKWKIVEFFVIIGIIAGLCFVRNPLYVRHLDASDEDGVSLEDIYSPVCPYVEAEHMMLTDSGYYTVSGDGETVSQLFFAELGGQLCFVELPVEAEAKSRDVTLRLQLMPADRVIAMAASQEGLLSEAYMEEFSISPIMASAVQNNRLQVYLYYALAVAAAIGILCVIIKDSKNKTTKERQVDYEK